MLCIIILPSTAPLGDIVYSILGRSGPWGGGNIATLYLTRSRQFKEPHSIEIINCEFCGLKGHLELKKIKGTDGSTELERFRDR